jgi:hypothetical protein
VIFQLSLGTVFVDARRVPKYFTPTVPLSSFVPPGWVAIGQRSHHEQDSSSHHPRSPSFALFQTNLRQGKITLAPDNPVFR